MKYFAASLLIIFSVLVSGCRSTPLAESNPEEMDSSLRIERKCGDSDNDGVDDYAVNTTYRNNKRILVERTDLKTKVSWRMYVVDAKTRILEDDTDGDGFYELLTIYGDDISRFERFRVSPNGRVIPVSKSELQALKKEQEELTKAFLPGLEEAVNIMLDKIEAEDPSNTNSSDWIRESTDEFVNDELKKLEKNSNK